MTNTNNYTEKAQELEIGIADKTAIAGTLTTADKANGLVIFAHGSGSSRFSPRNNYVAGVLRQRHFSTLLIDLLTKEEEIVDLQTRQLRFDIELLATRVVSATKWLCKSGIINQLPIGYYGASTGAAAALAAAAELGGLISAVVSRGGRPDLALDKLSKVKAPTLLIVGGNDYTVIEMNEQASEQLRVEKKLSIIPGAGHLFEEPGTLEQAALETAEWFVRYLRSK
jgi:pimeloyl-ACP methyl ester carboxylesterase